MNFIEVNQQTRKQDGVCSAVEIGDTSGSVPVVSR